MWNNIPTMSLGVKERRKLLGMTNSFAKQMTVFHQKVEHALRQYHLKSMLVFLIEQLGGKCCASN